MLHLYFTKKSTINTFNLLLWLDKNLQKCLSLRDTWAWAAGASWSSTALQASLKPQAAGRFADVGPDHFSWCYESVGHWYVTYFWCGALLLECYTHNYLYQCTTIICNLSSPISITQSESPRLSHDLLLRQCIAFPNKASDRLSLHGRERDSTLRPQVTMMGTRYEPITMSWPTSLGIR